MGSVRKLDRCSGSIAWKEDKRGVDTTESEGWVVTVDDILLRCGFDEMMDDRESESTVAGSWILV